MDVTALPGLGLGQSGDAFPASADSGQRLRLLGMPSSSFSELEVHSAAIGRAWSRSQADREHSTSGAQRLAERLVEVLNLAQQHVSRLEQYRPYWADPEDPFVSLADKIVVESAILALVATRCAGDLAQVKASVDRLAHALAPHVRSNRNEVMIRRYPHTAMSLGLGHAALSSIGLLDAHFDRLVRESLHNGMADCTERLPYRAMERRWLSGLLGMSPDLGFDDLLPQSIATSPVHPIYMLATDVYALTHVPMFMTDFGRIPAADAFPHADFCESLDATTAWVLQTDNYDLMAELVMARTLLGAPWTASQVLAWKTLEFAWDRLGFLNCPSFAIQQFHEASAEERSSYAFRHIYHTTYVAGMLCALLLRAPSADFQEPAPRPGGDAALREECRRAFGDAIRFCVGGGESGSDEPDIEALAQAAGSTHRAPPFGAVHTLVSAWHARSRDSANAAGRSPTVLNVLDHIDLPPDSVASSLADGLLTCAARDYDLSTLAHTLQVVVNSGLPMTTTVVAAARFLMRQQLPHGAIGGWFVAAENAASVKAAEITARLAAPLGALGYGE